MSEASTFLRVDQVKRYWRALFGNVQFTPDDIVCVRGIGEKGTKNEEFKEDLFIQPGLQPGADICAAHAARYADKNTACFIVPCVLSEARGTAANVKKFTCLLVDLDDGDTNEKLEFLRSNIGDPSLVVASGGRTKVNTPKFHIYYLLTEPSEDIPAVVTLRDCLAKKAGGDPQFGLGVVSNPYGRAHQPVRIAGSVHSKNEVLNSCEIIEDSDKRYLLSDLQDKINNMPFGPFIPLEKHIEKKPDSMFFEDSANSVGEALVDKVYEGGTDKTRWGEFSRVAGHYVHCIRRGEMSLQDALDNTLGWVSANMVPPWQESRSRTEFHAILSKDIGINGPMPAKMEPIVKADNPLGIRAWAAHRWVTEPKPTHSFLVEGLVIKGEPHLFVAEGGSGKTGLLLDLAMKIAAWDEKSKHTWCGNKVVGGGTVVVILNEDSMKEAHIRMIDIDRHGLKKKAGDKLIVLPMTVIGGAFPLVERDPRNGLSRSSQRWNEMIGMLKTIPDLCGVYIDTFNSVSHGDENSAMAIAEMMREAHRVCGEMGAALLFAHHIRKSSEPIRNLSELAAEIRGSTAIPSYFRIVFGLFHCGDYDRRMRAMNLVPKRNALWRFGIAKANINGLLDSEKTLLRNEFGILTDVTDLDKFAHVNNDEREAWLLKAIEIAAQEGHPFRRTKTAAGGVYKRRSELPILLKKVGAVEFEMLIENLLQEGKVFLCSKTGGSTKDLLDVKKGTLATNDYGSELEPGTFNAPIWEEEFEYTENRGLIPKRKNLDKMF